MLLVVLKPSKRAERYLKNDNIDIIRLETVINFIARYVDKRKKIEIIHIPFDIDCRKEDSEYFFSSRYSDCWYLQKFKNYVYEIKTVKISHRMFST